MEHKYKDISSKVLLILTLDLQTLLKLILQMMLLLQNAIIYPTISLKLCIWSTKCIYPALTNDDLQYRGSYMEWELEEN